uniref:Nudix hydrolase domain-containing protein n=1 Tax=Steinernema glaseri TaxID=37863 RepID=A0A1I7ZEJ8_9BILA
MSSQSTTRRLEMKKPIQLNEYFNWQRELPFVCTMNSDAPGPAYDSLEALGKINVPLLYIYAAYDPDDATRCGLLRHVLTDEYEKMDNPPRLTYSEFVTTLSIAAQTTNDFDELFSGIKNIRENDLTVWRRKTNEKVASVLRLLSGPFDYGAMEDEEVKKIIVNVMEWAADARSPGDLSHELRALAGKIFEDKHETQFKLCTEIVDSLKRDYEESAGEGIFEEKDKERYLHAFISQSTLVWPIQAFAVVLLKAIFSKQLSFVHVEDPDNSGTSKARDSVNSDAQVEGPMLPISDELMLDAEIETSMMFIATHLPTIVQTVWCTRFMEPEADRMYMWMDMVAHAFTLYAASACNQNTIDLLLCACDKIEKIFERSIANVTGRHRLVMKVMNLHKQIVLARGQQEESASLHTSEKSDHDRPTMVRRTFVTRSFASFFSAHMSASYHTKCRSLEKTYLRSKIIRTPVPDEKVRWTAPWPDYSPVDYTSKEACGKPWSDGDDLARIQWNQLDGEVDRRSHCGTYQIGDDKRPRNPEGRCGLRGRGVLGRWGPNHAADPIVSRFKDGKLQFVAIQRGDTGEWALPGGMVDKGEQVSQTLKREFTEEALNGITCDDISRLWTTGTELYKGYVDDPRNTDNSWMETVVVNFHDDTALLDNVEFKAGDDAVNVRWANVEPGLRLYASHEDFIRRLAQKFDVSF